jgi:hypothetical protein
MIDMLKRVIVHHRICRLSDASLKAFITPDGLFHGAPPCVNTARAYAIEVFEAGDIDEADRLCTLCKEMIVAEGLKFRARWA